ncbi:MAG: 50S ribosomal protein L18 [Deltaproteobacteria bacterium]|nr:50S ribosomal protein L18 [Deltaproteobacteria bacterium]
MAKKRTRGDARKRRHLRIRKKVFGTSDRPRLNVFRSLNEIYVQVIDDTTGHTLISASTVDKEIKKKFKGMTKKEQAKLVGQTIAERAKDKGIKSVVFDRGGYKYIGRVEALADGARENGLQF